MIYTKNKKVLFRCEANMKIGFGHLSRCLAIADILKNKYKYSVLFVIKNDQKAIEKLIFNNYEYEVIDDEKINNKNSISQIIKFYKIKFIFIDLKNTSSLEEFKILKKQGLIIATLDDSSDLRLISDLVFLPPLPQVKKLNWDNFDGALYIGWNWMPVRKEFLDLRRMNKSKSYKNFKSRQIKFLITMGGSDPKGFTISALNLLNEFVKIEKINIQVKVILGASFNLFDQINKFRSYSDLHFLEYKNVNNMHDFISETDLGLISFGSTAYEFATLGVQCFYYCLTQDHQISANEFEKNFYGKTFDFNEKLEVKKLLPLLINHINFLNKKNIELDHFNERINGEGSNNIAKVIHDKINSI